jgi:hypothetical protein
MIFARVDPELRDRVKAEANQRFEGNTSLVVRDAVRTYLRLRDHLGTRFDAAIDEMAPIERTEQSAA